MRSKGISDLRTEGHNTCEESDGNHRFYGKLRKNPKKRKRIIDINQNLISQMISKIHIFDPDEYMRY